jgi:hypothetical protein
MVDVAYTSRVRIERPERPNRAAYLPAEAQPFMYGVHGGRRRSVQPARRRLPGWALPARRIDPTGPVGHVTNEIELDGQVLFIKRIHVAYKGLSLSEDQREAAQRVMGVHAEGCPVARSLQRAIDIAT